jgi:murein DD-endopeptidase MepM/ murein hydrolase activator NlpD
MTDQQIKEVLHAMADDIPLPERFDSPSTLVRMTAERRQKLRGRVASVATGVLLLLTTAGLTAAAQGGLLGRSKQLETDTREVAEAARKVEETSVEIDTLSLSYPVRPPEMTSGFGPRKNPDTGETSLHTGVDFATPAGEPVTAAADGLVAAAGAYPELGNVVVISHGKVDGKAVSTWYAYAGELRVRVGQPVKRGDVIAVSGTSGGSSGPHIHFEVRVDGKPVDPTGWLGR